MSSAVGSTQFVTAITPKTTSLFQGCQMFYFQTQNPNLGKFWKAFDTKMLIYFMDIWNILQTLGKFNDHLVHFVLIWYILSGFWYHAPRKYGNPGLYANGLFMKKNRIPVGVRGFDFLDSVN
jgi:hypothetical protein